MKKHWSYYRAGFSAFLLMTIMAFGSTALGFFVFPVTTEFHIGRGQFTLYYSLMLGAGIVSLPFFHLVLKKISLKSIMFFSGIWMSGCFWGFSQSTSIFYFYIIGILLGLVFMVMTMPVASIIVNSYYTEKKSTVMGLVMSGSGVGGVLLSSTLPFFIERFGWRIGYRFLALLTFVFLTIAACVLKPLPENSREQLSSVPSSRALLHCCRPKKLLKLLLIGGILSFCCAVMQHLPPILEEKNISLIFVSVLMTIYTTSMAFGKILQGIIYEKLGLKKGFLLIGGFYGIAFLLLLQSGIPLLILGIIGLAVGFGCTAVFLPLCTIELVGTKNFSQVWGGFSAVISAISAICTPIWGFGYDFFQSYTFLLITSGLLLFFAIFIYFFQVKNKI